MLSRDCACAVTEHCAVTSLHQLVSRCQETLGESVCLCVSSLSHAIPSLYSFRKGLGLNKQEGNISIDINPFM